MNADHTSRAALTQLAQQPSLTAVPFTLAALGERVTWQAHTLAAELVSLTTSKRPRGTDSPKAPGTADPKGS